MMEGMKVHRSVKTRLEAKILQEDLYVPQVRPKIKRAGTTTDVDEEPTRLDYEEWNVDIPEHWDWVE